MSESDPTPEEVAAWSTRIRAATDAVCGLPLTPTPRPEGLQGPDDFWRQVNFRDSLTDCWIWCGPCSKFGHGMYSAFGRTVPAHRVANELVAGPIPYHLVIRHTCDNAPCVNPAHLIRGTQDENRADMVSRGRAPWQRARRGPGPLTSFEEFKETVCGALLDRWAERHGIDPYSLTRWFAGKEPMPPRVRAAFLAKAPRLSEPGVGL